MTISTRTPEGLPNRCPVCQRRVIVEPSLIFGDAPCPSCGTLLWFINVDDEPRWFVHGQTHPIRKRVLEFVAGKRGADISDLGDYSQTVDRSEVDSFELVELVMELELAPN